MKKRVLHILNTSSYSGAENVVITTINRIANQNTNIVCAYSSLDGSIRKILNNNKIQFFPIKKTCIKEIRRVVKIFKPDVIHAHDFTTSITCSMALLKIPIISHLHNNPLWIKKYNPYSIAYLISTINIKKILTVSPAVINEFVFSKYIRNKTKVVSNPIDIKLIQNKVTNNYVSSKIYDLVNIGRLDPQKDPIRFINIVSQVKKKIPDIKVIMIGAGTLIGDCIQEIKRLDLEKNIVMTGFLDNPYELLTKSKILCLTSKYEGYGLVAVEAMCFGVPVVASRVGGLVNLVNEECGYLCDSDDNFIDNICNLLINKNEYKNKCFGAINRANEINNIDQYIKYISDMYQAI